MSKVVWRDVHWLRILFLVFWIPFTVLELKTFGLLILDGPWYTRLLGFAISTFFLYMCIGLIRPSFTYLTDRGIRIGNAADDKYTSIRLNPVAFVEWKQVSEIKLLNKLVRRSIISVPTSFIVVITKDGKKHWCYLSRKKSFITKMTQLGKANLLSKGKSHDLFLEKQQPFIDYDSADIDLWVKRSLPWMVIVGCAGLFFPTPDGLIKQNYLLWLIITFGPPIAYLTIIGIKSKMKGKQPKKNRVV